MKPTVSILAVIFFCLSALTSHGQLSREPDSIYLEDVLDQPIKIPLKEAIPIYYDTKFSRYLGTLRRVQQLEVLAFTHNAYRVRGNAQQGQVAGWVPADSIAGLQPEFRKKIQDAVERKKTVDELIKNKEVALGMTAEEVGQSLGRPQKKSSRIDADGKSEVWEFITYETVPQYRTAYDIYNRPYTDTIYVKKPTGQMAVVMQNGIVSSIEKSEADLTGNPGRTTIVVPPITVY